MERTGLRAAGAPRALAWLRWRYRESATPDSVAKHAALTREMPVPMSRLHVHNSGVSEIPMRRRLPVPEPPGVSG